MIEVNKKLEKLKAFLASEEGQKKLEELAITMDLDNKHRLRWVERFKKYSEGRLDEVLEKIINKYGSDEYVRSEYSRGYQPREELLWVAYEFATHYCLPCEDEKYLNSFTADAYYIGSYVIQLMNGQGSVIKIQNIC
jgi:hypothetical protein